MSKLQLYKVLGIFIPYFKRKIMKIDYFTGNWVFLTTLSGVGLAVPRIGEHVVLYVQEQNVTYTVMDVVYHPGNIVKILLR